MISNGAMAKIVEYAIAAAKRGALSAVKAPAVSLTSRAATRAFT
jgi:hypothetical protein